jgi:hypothetical protein
MYFTNSMLLKILPCALYTSPLSVQTLQSRSRLYYLSYATWKLSHLNGLSLTTTKFKPLISSMSGFALSYTANMFIPMVLYDFCLLPAQFSYIIVHIWKVQTACKSRTGVYLGKYPVVQSTLFCRRCNFKR